jgi:hypothetical protein
VPAISRFRRRAGIARAKSRSLSSGISAISGDYSAFEQLASRLLGALASFSPKGTDGRPWTVQSARAALEGKGSPQARAGSNLECDLASRGWLTGCAFAMRRDGEQSYGFELTFYPGGKPPPGN